MLIAPFRVPGNIVTIGGKIGEIRIDPIIFPAGSEELTPESERQLKELADFLKQRRRIELRIRGHALENEKKELKRRLATEQIIPETGETYGQALSRGYRASGGEFSTANPPSVKSMEEYLADLVTIPSEAVQKLADKRAHQILSPLTSLGVEPGRLFVAANGQKEPQKTDSGRAEFCLLY